MEVLYAVLLFVAFVFALAGAATYKLVKVTHRGARRLIGRK